MFLFESFGRYPQSIKKKFHLQFYLLITFNSKAFFFSIFINVILLEKLNRRHKLPSFMYPAMSVTHFISKYPKQFFVVRYEDSYGKFK